MNLFGPALAISIALCGGTFPSGQDQKPPAQADEKKEPVSDADQIIRLQKFLEKNLRNLAATKSELDNPDSDFHRAENAYKNAEDFLQKKRAELKMLEAKKPPPDTSKLRGEIAELQKQASLARERFNVAIKEHKLLQERSALLTVNIAKIRNSIALLQGMPPPPAMPVPPAPNAAEKPAAKTSGTTENAEQPKVAAVQPDVPAVTAASSSTEVTIARKEAILKDLEVNKAKAKLQSIDDRIVLVDKNIDLEKRRLEAMQEKAKNDTALQSDLQKELDRKRAAKAPAAETASLSAKIADAEKRLAATRKEIHDTSDHLTELQTAAKKFQGDRALAQRDVDRAGKEAEEAARRAAFLESPFAPQNLLAWAWSHIPVLLVLILAIGLLQWFVRIASGRIARWVARYPFRGGAEERQVRADTLVGVFRNAATFLILAGGVLMILQAVDIPILPLLGGAAAGGLAVAFGAQNVIKDYFSGFMVLMEDQYCVNDVVRIGAISGQVEKITLRMTVLRDMEGTVHFIPHGTITTVSNMTHRWSRAFFEIHVGYHENIDRAIAVLLELCEQIRTDPAYAHFILAEPEMLGVDQLADTGIAIQFLLRTAPLKQWAVKRELLRRIKKRFDELGIELPHREYVCLTQSPAPPNDRVA